METKKSLQLNLTKVVKSLEEKNLILVKSKQRVKGEKEVNLNLENSL